MRFNENQRAIESDIYSADSEALRLKPELVISSTGCSNHWLTTVVPLSCNLGSTSSFHQRRSNERLNQCFSLHRLPHRSLETRSENPISFDELASLIVRMVADLVMVPAASRTNFAVGD